MKTAQNNNIKKKPDVISINVLHSTANLKVSHVDMNTGRWGMVSFWMVVQRQHSNVQVIIPILRNKSVSEDAIILMVFHSFIFIYFFFFHLIFFLWTIIFWSMHANFHGSREICSWKCSRNFYSKKSVGFSKNQNANLCRMYKSGFQNQKNILWSLEIKWQQWKNVIQGDECACTLQCNRNIFISING